MNILAVLILGAVGGIARFALSGSIYGVLFINLIGAFGLGYFITLADLRQHSVWVKDGVATGFIGSLTTFSTFMTDSVQIGAGNIPMAGLYILATLVGGVSLCFLGMRWAATIHQKRSIVPVQRQ